MAFTFVGDSILTTYVPVGQSAASGPLQLYSSAVYIYTRIYVYVCNVSKWPEMNLSPHHKAMLIERCHFLIMAGRAFISKHTGRHHTCVCT